MDKKKSIMNENVPPHCIFSSKKPVMQRFSRLPIPLLKSDGGLGMRED